MLNQFNYRGRRVMYLLIKEKWDNIWSGPENKFLVPFTFEDGYPGW